MRRAIVALVSTVVGLVLLLSFKSHTGTAATGIVATQPHATPKATKSPAGKPSPTATAKKQQASASPRDVTGDTIDTQYGPVQVRVRLTGSHIDDITALQLPQRSGRDIEIDNYAVPQLRQEALSAQSANIDFVSGATFTSDGYIRSLQSALDRDKD